MTDEIHYCTKCEYVQKATFHYLDDKMTYVSHRCVIGGRVMDVNEMTHMKQGGA